MNLAAMDRPRAIAIGVFLIAGLATGPAVAFESDEHETVSTAALRLVIDASSDEAHGVAAPILHEYLTGLVPSDGEKERLLLRSLERLSQARPLVAKRHGVPALTYGVLVKLVDFFTNPLIELRVWGPNSHLPASPDDIDVEFLNRLDSDFWAVAVASHLNTEHFQDDLLRQYAVWHRFAIQTAAGDHNLFAALLFNSYADHFLEDFFAPGHIQTPRRGLHDVAALGLHDNYNHEGADFQIGHGEELLPLSRLLPDEPAAQRLRTKLVENGTIRLFGDNEIDREPLERLFVTLVVARSIEDVVDSFIQGGQVNHFEGFTWKSRRLAVEEGKYVLYPADAEIRYGKYRFSDPADTIELFNRYRFAPSDLNLQFSPVIGLSADFEGLTSGRDTTRFTTTIEIMPIGVPPRGNILRANATGVPLTVSPQFGVGLGYSGTIDDGYSSHGPRGRIIFSLPVDTQVSFGGGISRLDGHGRDVWKPTYGATFEMGYGLLFARLGVEYTYYIDSRSRVGGSVGFVGGVTATLPWSRIRRALWGQ